MGKRSEAQIDEVDRRILRAVRDNGRVTTAELAERVKLSSSPCWTRLKRLETLGVIEGYAAILDQRKLGFPDTVILEISLDRHDETVLEQFGTHLVRLPEVLEAYLTTGEYDYLAKIAIAGTEGYERFLRDKLYRIPGIRHSRSSFALRCLKRSHSVEP